MMPANLLTDVQRIANAGTDLSTSHGTLVTANAVANIKGSYTQLIAATAYAAQGLYIMFENANTSFIDFLFDIAIGGAGSEQIIINNLLCSGGNGSAIYGSCFYFPIKVPVNTRIAARCQASTGSSTVRVSILLFSGGFANKGYNLVDTYGAAIGDSGGTSVDPGGSSNSKGSYVQIVASTTRLHRGLVIAIGNQLNIARAGAGWLLDIAIGGAGSEQVIIPNLNPNADTTKDMVCPQAIGFLPITIPVGTRLSARSQCNITDATDRLFDVVLYGVG